MPKKVFASDPEYAALDRGATMIAQFVNPQVHWDLANAYLPELETIVFLSDLKDEMQELIDE